MNLLSALFLGFIQGMAEFLPISSSGHLLFFQNLLGVSENNLLFDVVVHLGTLVPVCVVYFKDILALIKKPFQWLTLCLVVATIPAVIVAFVFGDVIDAAFTNTNLLPITFAITGFLLIYADMAKTGKRSEKQLSIFDSLLIGLVQAFAILPGISRSGSTITAGLTRGISREGAAKFSFLMSIPVILGAAVLEIKKLVTSEVVVESSFILPSVFGFLAAAGAGYLAIQFFVRLVKAGKLKYFAIYLFVIAFVVLLLNILG